MNALKYIYISKQEEKDFNNLASVKEKIRTLCFIQQGYTGKVVIENFPDLTQLNLGNNELEEIIIHNCPDLKLVQVAHNKLTKLKIENCPNVQENYTHNNQLTKNEVEKLDLSSLGLQGELNLEGFTNLKSLDCSDNELTDLDLYECKKLEYLDCSNNYQNEEGIDFLDVSACKELKELHANHCSLNLTNNKKLKHIYCYENQIEELEVKHLTELENSFCYHNNLRKLDCSGLKNLKDLYCANASIDFDNLLKTLNVDGCEALENLDCAENNGLNELNLINLPKLSFVSIKEYGLNQLEIKNCPM
ncbi:19019_t:CDS:2 [Entrophospora sp. SA101]|nr:19019_t:CDS:2 [Entrophospora sp. SA101]